MSGLIKSTPVISPLRKALTGPNRLGRNVAVAQAKRNVETLRADSTEALLDLVHRMEQLLAVPTRHLPPEAMAEGIVLAPVIFNLAGTFGYFVLQDVSARLHDLLLALQRRGLQCREPVAVVLSAAQLAAPGKPPLSKAAAEQLLSHLDRILAKYRTRADVCDRACDVCPAARNREN